MEVEKELEGTPCKFCQFAIYNDRTQTDCKFGLINKYRDLGVGIVEAYDSDKDFFVIQDKVCMFYRSSETFKNYTKEQIQQQNQFQFDAFIYIDVYSTIEQLEQTLVCLINQTIKPSRIIFILRPTGLIKPSQIRQLANKTINIPWKTETVINKDLTSSECIDSFSQNLKKEITHYCILRAGTVIDINSFKNFNDSIVEKLEVLLLMYINENEYIVSKHTHRILGGNSKSGLVTKLISIGDTSKCRKINCL